MNKHFTVLKKDAGHRLDKYLVDKLDGISRHGVKELLDTGRVRVNGKRVVIAKWETIDGDEVDVRLGGWKQQGASGWREGPERGPRTFVNVVYEDRDVVVVEKPVGVVVQLGQHQRGERTFVDSVREYLQRKHKGKASYVKAIHRLDKETSGLMVFAASRLGEGLVDQFKRHAVDRSYLAIVEGAVPKENGRVDLPINKGDFGHGRKVSVGRKGEGQRALTEYLVRERYKDASLVRLDLRTGRTHQARVHMAAIGHPIVGDKIYGKAGKIQFGRQALHSHRLGFKHPATGKRMNYTSNLPEDMMRLVEELRG